MIQTPVGMRCRDCAQLRRLPQHEVDAALLGHAAAGGLLAGTAAWLLVSFVPFLSFFAAILVGFAVAGAMSRLTKRRLNRALEVTAVCSVVLGYFLAYYMRSAPAGVDLSSHPAVNGIVLPLIVASFIAVLRLR